MDVSLRRGGGTVQAIAPVRRENELSKNAEQWTYPISVTVASKAGQGWKWVPRRNASVAVRCQLLEERMFLFLTED